MELLTVDLIEMNLVYLKFSIQTAAALSRQSQTQQFQITLPDGSHRLMWYRRYLGLYKNKRSSNLMIRDAHAGWHKTIL
jgi:hypothetical protein